MSMFYMSTCGIWEQSRAQKYRILANYKAMTLIHKKGRINILFFPPLTVCWAMISVMLCLRRWLFMEQMTKTHFALRSCAAMKARSQRPMHVSWVSWRHKDSLKRCENVYPSPYAASLKKKIKIKKTGGHKLHLNNMNALIYIFNATVNRTHAVLVFNH